MKKKKDRACAAPDAQGLMMRELPASERPREKLFSQGASALSNAELLAVLIASGTVSESAMSLAGRVLALEGGSLGALQAFAPEEFMRVKGIGKAKACTIAAALELGRRAAAMPPAERPVVRGPAPAADLLMSRMRHLQKEELRALLINAKSEVIMQETISIGGLTSAASQPREVFAGAIRKGACSIILAHNHPSGDPEPSEADRKATKQLAEAGRMLGIPLVDHIIIGDGVYFSFLENGLLADG